MVKNVTKRQIPDLNTYIKEPDILIVMGIRKVWQINTCNFFKK